MKRLTNKSCFLYKYSSWEGDQHVKNNIQKNF